MRNLPWSLIFLSLSLSPLLGLDDGFYAVSSTPTPVSITTLDGEALYLGAKIPDSGTQAKVISQTNDNTKYALQITHVGPFASDSFALVLGNKCARFSGMGSDSATHEFNTETLLNDVNFAHLAAAYFKVSLIDRHHPEYQFTCSFLAHPEGYSLGTDIPVTFRLTNSGQQSFTFFVTPYTGTWNGYPSPAFAFTAYSFESGDNAARPKPNHWFESAMDMALGPSVLKPQESKTFDLNMKDYLVLDHKTTYQVRGSLAFWVVQVGPVATSWEDYATDAFELKID